MATTTPRLGLSKPAPTDLVSAFQPTVDTSFDAIDLNIVVYRGAFNIATTYAANDMVSYTGALFVSGSAQVGVAPPGGTWAGLSPAAAGANPAVFAVETFGALGDVVGGTDGVVTGTAFSAASGAFSVTHVGKTIVLDQAGTAGAGFVTTIASVTDPTHLVLANAVTTNVASNVVWCMGTDDTTAVQTAITAAAAAGGGLVRFAFKRYLFTGHLTVPCGVVLTGCTRGPFGVTAVQPAAKTVASTLLPTDTSGQAFIQATANGSLTVGGGVEDLLIHYPNQATYRASAPSSAFGNTIQANAGTQGNFNYRRLTITNAYYAIVLGGFAANASGECRVEDCQIGAFQTAVYADNMRDLCWYHNIESLPLWDTMASLAAGAQTIDTSVKANQLAFVILSADNFQLTNVFAFSTHIGFYLVDSGLAITPTNGYGQATNCGVDTCDYGVYCTSTDTPGWSFTNLNVGAAAQHPVFLQTGGSAAPKVYVTGGSFWAGNTVALVSAGTYHQKNVIGSTDV